MISFMAEVIGIRDDMFLGEGNTYMREVAASVFERYRLATYREASFKPFVIAAMILMARVKNYPAALRRLAKD